VTLRSFVDSGGKLGASGGSSVFVTSSNSIESLLAKVFDASFVGAIAFSADDGLACAFDRRFVVGHNV